MGSHLTEQKLSDLTTTTQLESGGESEEPSSSLLGPGHPSQPPAHTHTACCTYVDRYDFQGALILI